MLDEVLDEVLVDNWQFSLIATDENENENVPLDVLSPIIEEK